MSLLVRRGQPGGETLANGVAIATCRHPDLGSPSCGSRDREVPGGRGGMLGAARAKSMSFCWRSGVTTARSVLDSPPTLNVGE